MRRSVGAPVGRSAARRGSGRGGRQQGRAARGSASGRDLVVKMALNRQMAGRVIGAGGETVKRTQRESGASVRLPPRGEEGLTLIAGPTALSVLCACRMISAQTIEDPHSGYECTCELAGIELRATLRCPEGQPWLFTPAETDPRAAFAAAYVRCDTLAVGSLLEALLDDIVFSAGLSKEQLSSACTASEAFVYALGDAVPALQTSMPALISRLCSSKPGSEVSSGAGGMTSVEADIESVLQGRFVEGLNESEKVALLQEVGIMKKSDDEHDALAQ
eukprot:scaffold157943_cov28-Tisochrysis_lutea.AAC.6